MLQGQLNDLTSVKVRVRVSERDGEGPVHSEEGGQVVRVSEHAREGGVAPGADGQLGAGEGAGGAVPEVNNGKNIIIFCV